MRFTRTKAAFAAVGLTLSLAACGQAGSSEDVAHSILFLASDRARHITGTPLWIDGGQGLLR